MDNYDKLYEIIQKKYVTIKLLRELIFYEHVDYIKTCGLSEDGKKMYEIKLDNGDKNILYLKETNYKSYIKDIARKIFPPKKKKKR